MRSSKKKERKKKVSQSKWAHLRSFKVTKGLTVYITVMKADCFFQLHQLWVIYFAIKTRDGGHETPLKLARTVAY